MRTDWLPAKRSEQIAMARTWLSQLLTDGPWSVTPAEMTELTTLTDIAQRAMEIAAIDKGSAAENAKAKEAFAALTRFMRLFRQRKFFSPPMLDSDWIRLGMKPRDRIPTVIPPPVSQVEGTLAFPGVGLVEMTKIQMVGGKIDRRADYGVRIYYGIMGRDAAHDKFRLTEVPRTGDDLPHSVFTRKRSHLFDFTGDSGCAVFFCMRYENSKGEAGPWGTIIEAYVP